LNKNKIDSIAMCTINFLPKEKNKMKKILKKACEKNIEFIFIFENIKFKNKNIDKFIKNILQIRKINYLTKK
jgi:sporadic carbohydrate cluster protein (TIGR04323 family)